MNSSLHGRDTRTRRKITGVGLCRAVVLAAGLAGCAAERSAPIVSGGESLRVDGAADRARAESSAWGDIGGRHLERGDNRAALEAFRSALTALAGLDAGELEYQWQWRSAQALRRLGEREHATAAFARAVESLARVRARERGDCDGRMAREYRSSAAELHREYVDLLLEGHPGQDDEETLRTARRVSDAIKLDEVRDYFSDECVTAAARQSVELDDVESDAAVLYPIVLPDRLELLLAVQGSLHRVRVPVTVERLATDCSRLRYFLELRTTRQYLPFAQHLYDLVIRPVEPLLQQHHVRTLVYVPGGPLGAVPASAFHDGSGFLAERYAIALAPGLQLVDPRPFGRDGARALVCGETTGSGGYATLPHVGEEVTSLRERIPGATLLDDAFTLESLASELGRRKYAILHMATHASFGERGNESFLVAHGQTISMDQLGGMVQSLRRRSEALELLTLSACETASGTERSALGLAGLAIKSGAKSAVASLWSVDDRATAKLMSSFYSTLLSPENPVPKGQALQRAQQALLGDPIYGHPAYWSAFVLVNNWR